MKLSDFDYELPKAQIAQRPQRPRDRSRLLVLNPATKQLEHKFFYDLIDYLQAGDVLVLNNTKVMAARLIGQKQSTGGKLEIFLLKKITPLNSPLIKEGKGNLWQCLVGRHGRHEGETVKFKAGLEAQVIKNNQDGTWQVKFNQSYKQLTQTIERVGQVPLPPYIKRTLADHHDKQAYQTVFADDKKLGSVAAPTAGLHFTPTLIKRLKAKGVIFEYVTLQVGLGTFAAVKTENITKHRMHAEWLEADKKTLAKIVAAKQAGQKIIAVGTTSARTLESIFKTKKLVLPSSDYSAWTDIFIYPGYKFKIIDGLITNFHVPKSTLLMLVSALAGQDYQDRKVGIRLIKQAYAEAIRHNYRFLSYGDAMLIRSDKQ